jgi:hypothetical protein
VVGGLKKEETSIEEAELVPYCTVLACIYGGEYR